MSPAALPLPSPLSSEHGALLAQFAARAETASLLWASGYLAGLARALDAPAQPQVPAHPDAGVRTTVLYGSQTGNARRAAEALHARLEAAGLPARLLRADAYPLRELADETLLYVVISTQGDGDPPDDARALFDHVLGKRAPRLERLAFSVLALGDSSYPKYCETGRQVDARLEARGASRRCRSATSISRRRQGPGSSAR